MVLHHLHFIRKFFHLGLHCVVDIRGESLFFSVGRSTFLIAMFSMFHLLWLSDMLYHITSAMTESLNFEQNKGANIELLKVITDPLTKRVVQVSHVLPQPFVVLSSKQISYHGYFWQKKSQLATKSKVFYSNSPKTRPDHPSACVL